MPMHAEEYYKASSRFDVSTTILHEIISKKVVFEFLQMIL